jgi:hypothetical protein
VADAETAASFDANSIKPRTAITDMATIAASFAALALRNLVFINECSLGHQLDDR